MVEEVLDTNDRFLGLAMLLGYTIVCKDVLMVQLHSSLMKQSPRQQKIINCLA